MKPKEKLLNKTKINNSKFPLPKIKYSSHNNSNSQKIKSAIRHFPKFHNNNHNNIEQFDIIQQHSYKSKEPKKEEQKFNYKTNLKIKNIYKQKNIYKNNIKSNELKINQNNLKYILKQFGLSEYLRKLYEFGYDNNNYLKIGTLTRKNFNNLLNNIHIFPGHTVKMEKFYEYLKKLNSNNNNVSYNYNYKKRKLNYNSIYGINNGNNVNKNNIYNNNKPSLNVGNKNKKCLSPRGRPKTSHVKGFSKPKMRIRNNYSGNKLMKKKILNNSEDDNSILIKSYLNDNRKFILKHNNKNNIENLYIYNNKEKNKDEYNILYNSCNNYNNSNNKEYEGKMNQNIERMLNYYMEQLNDKLDNSYETVEDSSLSYIVTSQINENHNNTNNNKENKVIPNYKLPSINNNKNKADKKLEIESIKKNNKLNDNDKLNKEKEIKKLIDEKETKIKSIKNNEDMKIKEEKKELIEEEMKKEANKTKEIKEEYKKDLKRFSDQEVSTKSKDSKEHEIEEEEILLLKEKEKKPIINNPINLKDNNNNNNLINNKNKKDSLLDDSYLLNEKYSLEQNIYETLRLNKSMDAENTNKDTLKFDIEFMCRCLALALMKHIEQGKEKMHITDLYPIIPNNSVENKKLKLNFSFFNQSFNQNMNLLTEFFCEKNNDHGNLGDLNMRSILEKFCLENGDIDNEDIDMMKHIKKKGDEKIIEKDNKPYHINGLYDMENEMKLIGELFSYSRKKSKNYQDLSENTKKILCKDLSYIKEIDSELNKTNNSKSNISKSNNNSNINKIENDEQDNDKENDKDNISQEDSKNNNENKTKIIDEEGKDDDDYNFNEDDFINEINISDNDNDNKKENINNDNQNDKNDNKITENDTKKEENGIKDKNNSINNNDKIEEESKKVEELNKNDINKININENLNINSLIKSSEKNEEKKPGLDIESSYIIDVENMIKFKEYLLKQFEIFDDDYLYYTMTIPARRFMPAPDPQTIFEFCANIMILTKMEKEVIIISLIYIERLIFNTGFIINSRNWRKIIFIALIIASKIWDDDSLENIHYSQVFTHLKIGEINLLERTFLELINYKVFVKFSEYINYYFAIKNLALKYNFNGEKIVPVSVEKMMKIQEYAYQMQKRMRRKVSLNNSAHF